VGGGVSDILASADVPPVITVDPSAEIPVSIRPGSVIKVGLPSENVWVPPCAMNYLFEVKDPMKARARRRLTYDEAYFHAYWPGQIDVIWNEYDALHIMGVV
jgi:hypothetical protein